MIKIKNDKYRKIRGGKSKVLDILCADCDNEVLLYQKDGDGNLIRCYINRIFSPPKYEKLQYDNSITEPKQMPNLTCSKCNSIIGVPMRHEDGRLAFRLKPGSLKKRITTKKEVQDG